MDLRFVTRKTSFQDLPERTGSAFYEIFLFRGAARFSIDCADYESQGRTALFLTPYQTLSWHDAEHHSLRRIRFHGDYYCIEYHREEVACNGVLFNDVYEVPYVNFGEDLFAELLVIGEKMEREQGHSDASSEAVVRSYLQVLLALCSRAKLAFLEERAALCIPRPEVAAFRDLLERHFHEERSPGFYVEQLGVSPRTFNRLLKDRFGKPPGAIIRERVVLEAKRLLHLTHKSIKEVATLLRFEDEFYFSRYFKKETGISPQHFRNEVGISKAAK